MPRIVKSLRVKNSNGRGFSDPYPFGANAVNIEFDSGDNLENKMTEIEGKFDDYAEKNHASPTQEYGLATNDNYGHVKLADSLELGDDSDNTAVNQTCLAKLFNQYMSIFKLFEEESLLYSTVNTAYSVERPGRLVLVPDYFEVNEQGDTLTIK